MWPEPSHPGVGHLSGRGGIFIPFPSALHFSINLNPKCISPLTQDPDSLTTNYFFLVQERFCSSKQMIDDQGSCLMQLNLNGGSKWNSEAATESSGNRASTEEGNSNFKWMSTVSIEVIASSTVIIDITSSIVNSGERALHAATAEHISTCN